MSSTVSSPPTVYSHESQAWQAPHAHQSHAIAQPVAPQPISPISPASPRSSSFELRSAKVTSLPSSRTPFLQDVDNHDNHSSYYNAAATGNQWRAIRGHGTPTANAGSSIEHHAIRAPQDDAGMDQHSECPIQDTHSEKAGSPDEDVAVFVCIEAYSSSEEATLQDIEKDLKPVANLAPDSPLRPPSAERLFPSLERGQGNQNHSVPVIEFHSPNSSAEVEVERAFDENSEKSSRNRPKKNHRARNLKPEIQKFKVTGAATRGRKPTKKPLTSTVHRANDDILPPNKQPGSNERSQIDRQEADSDVIDGISSRAANHHTDSLASLDYDPDVLASSIPTSLNYVSVHDGDDICIDGQPAKAYPFTILHEFQKVGVKWLLQRTKESTCFTFGDEKRIGQQIQVTTFLQSYFMSNPFHNVGLVVPSKFLHLWFQDGLRWLPKVNIHLISSPGLCSMEAIMARHRKGGLWLISNLVINPITDVCVMNSINFDMLVYEADMNEMNSLQVQIRALKKIQVNRFVLLWELAILRTSEAFWKCIELIADHNPLGSYQRFIQKYLDDCNLNESELKYHTTRIPKSTMSRFYDDNQDFCLQRSLSEVIFHLSNTTKGIAKGNDLIHTNAPRSKRSKVTKADLENKVQVKAFLWISGDEPKLNILKSDGFQIDSLQGTPLTNYMTCTLPTYHSNSVSCPFTGSTQPVDFLRMQNDQIMANIDRIVLSSSKLTFLERFLDHLLETKKMSAIICFSTTVLDIIACIMKRKALRFLVLDTMAPNLAGGKKFINRIEALDEINFVITHQIASSLLNTINPSHIVIVDPVLIGLDEPDALDRIARGIPQSVFIYYLYLLKSQEEHLFMHNHPPKNIETIICDPAVSSVIKAINDGPFLWTGENSASVSSASI